MKVVMFGAMWRYNVASRLRLRNVEFTRDGNIFILSLEKRKSAKFRQGNKVTVAAATHGPVCPLNLLRMMRLHTGGGGGT